MPNLEENRGGEKHIPCFARGYGVGEGKKADRSPASRGSKRKTLEDFMELVPDF
jgi:hypothetical protein